jgi:hypothetical protein
LKTPLLLALTSIMGKLAREKRLGVVQSPETKTKKVL